MPDHLTLEARSRNMAQVKSRDTKPERLVRSLLHRMGYRFRLHRKELSGCPDIVLPRHRKVIFVHGCFWHGHPGCRRSGHPSTHREFWDKKIDATIARDTRNLASLEESGWKVLVVWECETRNHDSLFALLSEFMHPSVGKL